MLRGSQTCADWSSDDLDRGLEDDAHVIGSVLRGEATWHEHAEAVAEAEAAGEHRASEDAPRARPPRIQRGEDGRQRGYELGDDDSEDPFAAEMAAVGTDLRRVCRLCGAEFVERDNHAAACRHHPGSKRVDANWNSVWTCCALKAAARGCLVGAHAPALDAEEEEEEEEEEEGRGKQGAAG